MFGIRKRKSNYTPVCIPAPRALRQGEMEPLLLVVVKCAGRPLRQWEANVMETLIKAAREDEVMHG